LTIKGELKVRSRSRSSRFLCRVAACFALAALVALGVSACGSSEETQSLTFTISDDGKGTKISGPSSAETGLAEITLKNDGKAAGEMQLVRVEGDHSAAEAIKGLSAATQGQAFPDWFFAAGGVAGTAPGKSKTVTQVLEPGTYYAFETEAQGQPEPSSIPAVEVSGDSSGEEVEADQTVDAFDYGFKSQELPSGKTEIAFDNTGAQPHHLLAAPLLGDSTAADVERAFKSNKGKPPFDEKSFQSTAVLEGGEGQLVTLDLEPGRYVLFCFVTDRQGGQPHALKGMVDEVEVK
jgi:hypothetical protein